MSFINEALKKAQKEKESRKIEFAGVIAGGERKKIVPSVDLILYSLIIVAVILLLFVSYSWLRSESDEQRDVLKDQAPGPDKVNRVTPEMLYIEAKKFHKAGRIREAKELYMEILKLDPAYTDALNNLGLIFIHEQDYPTGRKYLQKAILLKPGYAVPYYNLACLLSIEGAIEESLVYLQKAVSLDRKVKEWAMKDTDLENLRRVAEFNEIIIGEVK